MPWNGRRPSKSNPRRPPAHLSVSLRHTSAEAKVHLSEAQQIKPNDRISYSKDSHTTPLVDGSSDGSPISLQLLSGKNRSGESSNVDEWFFQSNNERRDTFKSFTANDPPFNIRKSSSSDALPEDQQWQWSRQGLTADPTQQSRPRTALLQLRDDRNTTEDFRSIIDDLTMENKKLKGRLDRHMKLCDTHNSSNVDKLFEVRVHSMEAEEKRELEEILYKFVRRLAGREEELGSLESGCECTRPDLNYHTRTSSQASPQNGDSAYASMSASGLDSSTPSIHGSRHDRSTQPVKRQKLHSHHYTPEDLTLPLTPTTMAERAKKRLVVGRLEQIFAGRSGLASNDQQAVQRGDMLHTADLKNDSGVCDIRTDTEVSREAVIMREDTEDTLGCGTQEQRKMLADSNRQAAQTVEKRTLASILPNASLKEQRPTWPTDLDPIRAPCPVENLGYLRHLGFSPLGPANSLEEGGGWIDLNLLMNMAQLHILNVTCDFVREALSEYSVHFEMSKNGQKVRWKSHSCPRSTGTHTGNSSWPHNDHSVDAQRSSKKRLKYTQHYKSRSSSHPDLHCNGTTSHRYAKQQITKPIYKPRCHDMSRRDSEECSSTGEKKDNMPYIQQASDKLALMPGSDICAGSNMNERKLDTGLIIFYHNACFFTDLTGESVEQRNLRPQLYSLHVQEPVGKPESFDDTQYKISERRGPLEEAKELPEPMELTDNPIPESMELSFPQPSSPKCTDQVHGPHNINLEATGIGGIYPADNFAINVEIHHLRAEPTAAPTVTIRNAPGVTHDRLVEILRIVNPQRRVHAAAGYLVSNIQRIDYLPSALPSPLCFILSEGESTSEEGSSVG